MTKIAENFESGWGGGNHGSAAAYLSEYLTAGLFNDGNSEKEDFTYGWKQPALEGTLVVGAGEGASFSAGDDIFDRTSRKAGLVTNVATDTLTVRIIHTPPQLVDSGIPFGEAGAVLGIDPTYGVAVLGDADGNLVQFGGDIGTTPVERTVRILVTFNGEVKELLDNGAGAFIDSEGLLDSNFTNSVNYSTGVVNVTFLTAPDAGTQVLCDFVDVGSDATVDTDFSRASFAPFNNSGFEAYSFGTLALGVRDTFEDSWSSNENSQQSYDAADLSAGAFDSSTPENFEDFEEEWGGNEGAQGSYGGGDLSAGSFDSGPAEDFEDFEDQWTTTLQF